MTKRRGRKLAKVDLQIGEDPSLWCYTDLNAALKANIDGIARLIRIGEDMRRDAENTARDTDSAAEGAA